MLRIGPVHPPHITNDPSEAITAAMDENFYPTELIEKIVRKRVHLMHAHFAPDMSSVTRDAWEATLCLMLHKDPRRRPMAYELLTNERFGFSACIQTPALRMHPLSPERRLAKRALRLVRDDLIRRLPQRTTHAEAAVSQFST